MNVHKLIIGFATYAISAVLLTGVVSAMEIKEGSVEEYIAYMRSIESEETFSSLTPEEEAAGIRLIDGRKYGPEEGDGDEADGIYDPVPMTETTGFVNFLFEVPDYVHSPVFVHLMDHEGVLKYGCVAHEANDFYVQLGIPSGVYTISEGGVLGDTRGRFIVDEHRIEVTTGCMQNVKVKIHDLYPEQVIHYATDSDADEAELSDASVSETDTDKTETSVTGTSTELSQSSGEKEPASQKQTPAWMVVLLTIIFTLIPIIGFVIYKVYTEKPPRGFDD